MPKLRRGLKPGWDRLSHNKKKAAIIEEARRRAGLTGELNSEKNRRLANLARSYFGTWAGFLKAAELMAPGEREQAERINRVFDLKRGGMNRNQIAKALGISSGSVSRDIEFLAKNVGPEQKARETGKELREMMIKAAKLGPGNETEETQEVREGNPETQEKRFPKSKVEIPDKIERFIDFLSRNYRVPGMERDEVAQDLRIAWIRDIQPTFDPQKGELGGFSRNSLRRKFSGILRRATRQSINGKIVSLDKPIRSDSDLTIADTLVTEGPGTQEAVLRRMSPKIDEILRQIADLPDLERRVLTASYAYTLVHGEEASYKQLMQMTGLSWKQIDNCRTRIRKKWESG